MGKSRQNRLQDDGPPPRNLGDGLHLESAPEGCQAFSPGARRFVAAAKCVWHNRSAASSTTVHCQRKPLCNVVLFLPPPHCRPRRLSFIPAPQSPNRPQKKSASP